MAMTLDTMTLEVRENIKRTVAGVSDARIWNMINWAQTYLADMHTYKEMQCKDTSLSTTAHSSTLAWPTRMKELYSATVQGAATSTKLIYTTPSEFDRLVPYPQITGENLPKYYIDFGSTFELFPTPAAVYPIYFRISCYPSELTTGNVSDLLRKDALIVAIATTFGLWSLRELEDASYWGTQLTPVLYNASLVGDHPIKDWQPIARGFNSVSTEGNGIAGNWWENPFTGRRAV